MRIISISKLLVGLLLAVSLLAAPAVAADKMEMKGHGMMDHGMMTKGAKKKHHAMMRDMMGMLKETMAIVRDLSGAPTPAQKKRLDEMIKRMDEIMEMHKKMMKGKGGGKSKM